ncbi:ATPase GET3 [Porphyridium purpureum]|uniref:ATPase GET3 n=1 Tax=Porphyridium purpureum TaxID=35688 RepID=A0A5J4YQC7_PORPP|nr:ATPase GET3 [Porphyridium purpureum]|eukprot:POR3352..scf296_7
MRAALAHIVLRGREVQKGMCTYAPIGFVACGAWPAAWSVAGGQPRDCATAGTQGNVSHGFRLCPREASFVRARRPRCGLAVTHERAHATVRMCVPPSSSAVEEGTGGETDSANSVSDSASPSGSRRMAPLARALEPLSGTAQRFVLVGGKGGVGKTSTAAAMAVHCAAKQGMRTLVVSTDPAHSLGDALDVPLSQRGVVRVGSPGDDTGDMQLYALEIDTEAAAEEFKALVSGLTSGEANGLPKELVDKLGLAELGDLFDTLPPGADELVALAKVMQLSAGKGGLPDGDTKPFDRIIIDTAPTGHTLRMLAFPDFVDSFLGKAIKLRSKLDKVRGMIDLVMASQGVRNASSVLNASIEDIEAFRTRVRALADMLRDPARCEFVAVTIATKLAVDETERLVHVLTDEGVWVRNVVVNQLVRADSATNRHAFLERVVREQKKSIARIEAFLEQQEAQVVLHKVMTLDEEIRDVYGLRFFALKAFADFAFAKPDEARSAIAKQLLVPSGASSDEAAPMSPPQFVFMGGKGGVGKTTSSASLGVKFADEGLRTLVLSTDPAHSLGDAFGMELSGGNAVAVNGLDGMLYAMEIDTAGAVAEFRSVVSEFAKKSSASGGGGSMSAKIANEIGIADFADILDNTPPGIDELLALTKVMSLIRGGQFDRIIVDTAPTGHTLRLLAFPDFIDGFLGKIMSFTARVRRLLGGLSSLSGIFKGGAGGQGSEKDRSLEQAVAKLEMFQHDARFLRYLVTDHSLTQFCIVSIPTVLSVAESERLFCALKRDGVALRNIVINQIVPLGTELTPGADAARAEQEEQHFVDRRVKAQAKYVERLHKLSGASDDMFLTQVPFFDMEVRGIYGLQAMADVLFSAEQASQDDSTPEA